MNETLVVSRRGQFTLPAVLRKRFGPNVGDVLILGDRGYEIVLKPRVVIETHCYGDERIVERDELDKLTHEERLRILDKLG